MGELAGAETLYAQEMQLALTLQSHYPGESMWVYRQVRALTHRITIGIAFGRDAEVLQDCITALRLFTPLVEQDGKTKVGKAS